jgi:hypothetical protein
MIRLARRAALLVAFSLRLRRRDDIANLRYVNGGLWLIPRA